MKLYRRWLMLDRDRGYPYGVLVGPSLADKDELHGPFATEDEARSFARELLREFSDYQYANVVKIEVPHVSTVERETFTRV